MAANSAQSSTAYAEHDAVPFIDRRNQEPGAASPGRERRQFANNYDELSPEAREVAQAVDEYKINRRRRFITYEEVLDVMRSLGYHK